MASQRLPLTEAAICVARIGGDIALAGFRAPIAVENKSSNDFDPVTHYDRAAEQAMREHIASHYAQDEIVGEEFATTHGSSGRRWVLDPIDGTRAFVCGVPVWATLVGVVENDAVIAGVAHFPALGETYYGDASGAWLLGPSGHSKLAASGCTQLPSATITATTPDMFDAHAMPAFTRLSKACKMVRYGLDAYGACLLARGHIDALCESDLKAVDFMPLLPIVAGAGGNSCNWRGDAPSMDDTQILMTATSTLATQAIQELYQ